MNYDVNTTFVVNSMILRNVTKICYTKYVQIKYMIKLFL